ncbi:FecR family protein [Mucilaginibacter sp.]|jgi:ferric-dicitrate binding protein FerR (iron transport regulator)|uniref:FecR family protein n=1 Tax=Mucilaginibacter sp. TaxID=1882438 RepID=UPI0035678E0F
MEKLNPFEKADLIWKYLRDECNAEEVVLINKWLASDKENQLLIDKFKNEQTVEEELRLFSSVDKGKAWQRIIEQTKETENVIPFWRRRKVAMYAAVIVSICMLSGVLIENFLVDRRGKGAHDYAKTQIRRDIHTAKLTLSDGKVVILDQTTNRTLFEDDASKITKVKGQLVYHIKPNKSTRDIPFNSISTSVGGQYEVILPDQSKVWLNAMSSLRFPTVFTGKERNVELIGEAYFEVSKNKNMPFTVRSGKTKVEVLGTHFNVMAYANEKAKKITLLEGSVKVNNENLSKVIKPGQQAVVMNDIKISEVDLTESIAWKQGLFHFNNAQIDLVMRQLQRWYDVEVVYEGKIPEVHLSGIISRNTDIKDVLKMINISGNLHFEVRGRKIIVKSAI